jgi:hypothetical protein
MLTNCVSILETRFFRIFRNVSLSTSNNLTFCPTFHLKMTLTEKKERIDFWVFADLW